MKLFDAIKTCNVPNKSLMKVKYIPMCLVWFGLVWFYGISTIVGHLKPNYFYTYTKYMISKNILKITFLNKPEPGFLHTVKWFHLISNNSV